MQLLNCFGQEFGEEERWKELGRHSFSGPQGWATLAFALEFNTGRSRRIYIDTPTPLHCIYFRIGLRDWYHSIELDETTKLM